MLLNGVRSAAIASGQTGWGESECGEDKRGAYDGGFVA